MNEINVNLISEVPENYTGIVIYSDGSKEWWVNGKRHRIDGPAVEYANGNKFWYINGKRHREDGPAIEGHNGKGLFYLNGVKYSKKEFQQWIAKNELNKKLQTTLEPSPLINRGKI